jgi:hypothetical protein
MKQINVPPIPTMGIYDPRTRDLTYYCYWCGQQHELNVPWEDISSTIIVHAPCQFPPDLKTLILVTEKNS